MALRWIGLVILTVGAPAVGAEESVVAVGSGGYATMRPAGAGGPPATIFATSAAKGKMPTNDWWSSLAWMPFSERHYPHPLAVQAEPRGLRVYYPGQNITATRDAIFGFMPPDNDDDLILGHSEQERFADARVDGWSDWFVSVRFSGEKSMTVSYGHGSPYVFARYEGGSPRVAFSQPPQVWHGDVQSAALGVTIQGKHYGLFAPTGSTWEGLGTATLRCRTDEDYFSVAILPDATPATLQLFRRYAYNHVTETRVQWEYDEPTGAVTTTFMVKAAPLEGDALGTLLALYPHQWRNTNARLLDLEYGSVRGQMRLLAGSSFQTKMRFPGVLPGLPRVQDCDPAVLRHFLRSERQQAMPPLKDTYWEGKWLGRTATLIPIAEQFDEPELADHLRRQLKTRLEDWFSAEGGENAGLFCYDDRWGTLIGYPASFGSDTELNDHHFHYGYFVRAAAEIARIDPQWARSERWGGMVKLLIRDIASPDRNDPLFPFLRNFDSYAGHSWASGHARFGDGNNNESSSEAMNAWYGLILWGEFTGDRTLRDLGVYLYTTEMHAIQEYWFDVRDENHPPSFTPSVVTMIWGGKGANGTWFSANPEVVHGINWLPIHGGSLYLGHFPNYVRKNYAALVQENGGAAWDEWADLIWMYQALADPREARKQFDAGHNSAPQESGNSLANAYQWICTLQTLGLVQGQVTADYPLFAVFDQGPTRSYVVYLRSNQTKTVTFSDGFRLEAKGAGFHLRRAAALGN